MPEPVSMAAMLTKGLQGVGQIAGAAKAAPAGPSRSDGAAIAEGDVFNFGAAPGSDDGIGISRTGAMWIAVGVLGAAYIVSRS